MDNSESQKGRAEEGVTLAHRVEYFARRFFERLGGALDFALRRPLNPQPRTDVTALVPQLERAVEEKLKHEGGRVVAPNLIELRYDYETYSRMTAKRRDFLERELRATLYEYAHNRRYVTEGDIKVKVGFDVFTRKLTIIARFPGESEETAATQNQNQPPATAGDAPAAQSAAQAAARRVEVVLRSRQRELRAKVVAGAPASVGRSHDNALVIEDASVSNVHAAFSLQANGTLWLADLGSSNGTCVNGALLGQGDKGVVRGGDRLQFGDVEVSLEVKG
jgi:hypothetical protein